MPQALQRVTQARSSTLVIHHLFHILRKNALCYCICLDTLSHLSILSNTFTTKVNCKISLTSTGYGHGIHLHL